MSREQYLAYQTYMKAQQEALSLGGARYPSYLKSRSPLLPGAIDQNQPEQFDDALAAAAAAAANAAPLELRRVNTPGGRTSTIPQSLQSPGDRATGKFRDRVDGKEDVYLELYYYPLEIDSPQVAQVYLPGTRFPAHPHYPEAGARYYDNPRSSLGSEPPPAHRPANLAAPVQNLGMAAPAGLPHIYSPYQKPQQPQSMDRQGVDQQQQLQREREQQQAQQQQQPRTLQNPGESFNHILRCALNLALRLY